jgi:SprT-like family
MPIISGRWTVDRLQRLYSRYNKVYWRGKLPRCDIRIENKARFSRGCCNPKGKIILIDIRAHRSARAIYETLLHEMVHVAVNGTRHGNKFLGVMECLLRKGAPVGGTSEPGLRRILLSRFPLCRALAEKEGRRETRFGIRAGVYGDPICDRPGCDNILAVPEGRLFPRARFCSNACRNWARQHARRGAS